MDEHMIENRELMSILEKQLIDVNQIYILRNIFISQDNVNLAISYCYNYGIIQGKRQERQKKK